MRVLVTGTAGPVTPDGAWPGAPVAAPGAVPVGPAPGGAPGPHDVAAWWSGAHDPVGSGVETAYLGLAASGPAFLDALAGAAPELLAAVVPGEHGAETPVALRRDGRTGTVFADASQVPAVDHPGDEPAGAARSSAALGHLLAVSAAAARTPDGRPGRVVLATGGARSHDGGAGLLRALAGQEAPGPDAVPGPDVAPGPDAGTADVLRSARAALGGTSLVAAVATDAPLLGLHGASAALAARGVDDVVAQDLERRLGAVAHDVAAAVEALDRQGGGTVVGRDLLAAASPRRLAGLAGAGSGGGAAFALAALGGRLLPAPRVVADAVGLDAQLAAADLVVVVADELGAHELGEGAVREVAQRAAGYALPVVAVARTVVAGRREQTAAGLSGAHAWGDGSPRALVERVARTWSRA